MGGPVRKSRPRAAAAYLGHSGYDRYHLYLVVHHFRFDSERLACAHDGAILHGRWSSATLLAGHSVERICRSWVHQPLRSCRHEWCALYLGNQSSKERRRAYPGGRWRIRLMSISLWSLETGQRSLSRSPKTLTG